MVFYRTTTIAFSAPTVEKPREMRRVLEGKGDGPRGSKKVPWKRVGERGGCSEAAKSAYRGENRKDGGHADPRERRRGEKAAAARTRRTGQERKEENARDRGLLLARLPACTMHHAPGVTAVSSVSFSLFTFVFFSSFLCGKHVA